MNRVAFYFFLLASFSGLAQSTLSTKSKKAIELYTEADNYRVRGQFAEAIALLNQALEKDDKFVEAYYRLALVYFNIKQYPRSIALLEKGLTFTTDIRKQKIFWYDMGEVYLLSGQYEKAMKVLRAFIASETQNKQKIERATTLLRSAEFAFRNQSGASNYQQRPLSDTVNCFGMQYFPVLTADQNQLIFTRRVTNNPNDDEDLVVSRKNAKGRWTTPVSISKNINTRLNEGTCSISADGRKLILTSCTGRDGIGSCDLYESRKIGDEWSEPVNLGPNVNSTAWESQPSLSADGRTLYFVSDRRAGLGRRDIWISTLDKAGNWTKAVNAGKPVNTQFDEISPFIHVNGKTLYFASNGLPGFGGYDIFYVERDSSGWTAPKNIGGPVNTHEDQFSLFITADGTRGYYSHEETLSSGMSDSKIYELIIPAEAQLKYRSNYVKGVVRDKKNRQPLAGRIELINLDENQVVSRVESDSVTGEYLMVLTQGADYGLYVTRAGYLFKSLNFNYSAVTDFEPLILDIDLERAEAGSMVVLNNIFFGFDEYTLTGSSVAELQQIIDFLKENPHLKVEIGGHTDNAGSASYNRTLSLKRAQSVFNYLVEGGIKSTRLLPKGYGPDRPLGPNDTEDQRKLNRRIEFRVIF
ncbi:MAG TPA: OmpA family protein [Ohtaekwangia sp.]|nr:OmpA family protein [Ohtaekwangia sp.]